MDKDVIKLGIIGFGARGTAMTEFLLTLTDELRVTAVCDLYEDRVNHAAELVIKAGYDRPFTTLDYHEVIERNDVDAVVIMSSWESHIKIALYSMEKGTPVAMEVGGCYEIYQCWQLVDQYKKTQTPIMFLENCCFGRRELMVLNMARLGVLGTIVHASGGYCHDLRYEISHGVENRHYRLENYIHRNCENYPTHELGPIAKILKINRGNRLISLTSTASKSAGLHKYISDTMADHENLLNTKFNQGDIVTTVIKCANGETITLTLDTTLPRYYSRGFTIRGTAGMYEEATDSVFLDNGIDSKDDFSWRENKSGNAKFFEEKYDHPLWKKFESDGIRGSHGGMDGLEFMVFFDCLRNHKPMPIDVYDAVTYMCISALSEQSISTGSAPVAIPDFTCGKWITEKKDYWFDIED